MHLSKAVVTTFQSSTGEWHAEGGVARLTQPRKAVMLYINGGDLVNARLLINKCPPKEASTQYLKFLIAVLEGREESGAWHVASAFYCH